MDIIDLIDYIKDPSNYPVILIFLSGYVISSLLAGESRKWKAMNQMEKLIASVLIGVALDLGIVLPPIMIIQFWQGTLTLDFNSLLQQTSMYFTLFGGTTALFLSIYGAPRKAILKFLRILFRFIIFTLFVLMLVSIGVYFQMLGYPEYIRIYTAAVWSFFLLVNLLVIIVATPIYYFVELLFITPLLREGSVILARLPSEESGIRKVEKLSYRDRLMLRAPSRRKTKKTLKILFLTSIVVLVSLVIVPLDKVYPFLTPRLHQGIETKYDDRILSRIILLGNQPFEDDFSFKCYQMVYVPYRILVPSFWGYPVRVIGLESPSDYSKNGQVGDPTSPWSWSDVERMWVKSTAIAGFDFEKSEGSGTIERVWVDWSNLTGRPFSFNITYYEVVGDKVTVDAYYSTSDCGNQTSESYCFLVNNMEDVSLVIPRIAIDRLHFAKVILNSTRIFRDGHELLPDFTKGYVYPSSLVPASSTVNVTVSFFSGS